MHLPNNQEMGLMRLRCEVCGCFVHAGVPAKPIWAEARVQPCKRCLAAVREPNTEKYVVKLLVHTWWVQPGLLTE